jgi:hypothetical protein
MVVAAGLLLACDRGLQLGDPKPDAGGTGGNSGAATGGTDAGGGTSSSSGDVVLDGGTCSVKATCSTPAGLVQNTFPGGQAEVYSIFVGKWQICAGGDISFPGIPKDAIGVEYDAPPDLSSDGLMWYLVQGPNGPVRGQGFDYQLTYNLYPEGPNSYQLDMYQNGGFGGQWRYSPCPKELQIEQTEGSGEALLVPF